MASAVVPHLMGSLSPRLSMSTLPFYHLPPFCLCLHDATPLQMSAWITKQESIRSMKLGIRVCLFEIEPLASVPGISPLHLQFSSPLACTRLPFGMLEIGLVVLTTWWGENLPLISLSGK